MIHFVELSLLARLYKFQEAQFYAKIASHSLNAGLRYVFTTIQHHSNWNTTLKVPKFSKFRHFCIRDFDLFRLVVKMWLLFLPNKTITWTASDQHFYISSIHCTVLRWIVFFNESSKQQFSWQTCKTLPLWMEFTRTTLKKHLRLGRRFKSPLYPKGSMWRLRWLRTNHEETFNGTLCFFESAFFEHLS